MPLTIGLSLRVGVKRTVGTAVLSLPKQRPSSSSSGNRQGSPGAHSPRRSEASSSCPSSFATTSLTVSASGRRLGVRRGPIEASLLLTPMLGAAVGHRALSACARAAAPSPQWWQRRRGRRSGHAKGSAVVGPLAAHRHARSLRGARQDEDNDDTTVPPAPHARRALSTTPAPALGSTLASPAAAAKDDDAPPAPAVAAVVAKPPATLVERLTDPTAPPAVTNRWAMVAPVFVTHLCIGSPWGWSIVAKMLQLEQGFVAPAASDWTLTQTSLPLSIVFCFQGVGAAAFGKLQMRLGPRKSLYAAGACFGGGLLLGGVGIATHNLWLVYLGYGVLGGSGIGLAYTPPIQTLMQWFPDRKGIASSIAVTGFGSGALLFAPLIQTLRRFFIQEPTFVGPAHEVTHYSSGGKMFTELGGQTVEVVMARQADLAKLGYDLSEGLYVVGTGSSGVGAALSVIGVGYGLAIALAGLTIRNPAPGYSPPGYKAPAMGEEANVTVDDVMKTPQFKYLALTFFFTACSGIGLFTVASPMITDTFATILPTVVSASFASTFVLFLSAGNVGGRLGWSAVYERFGPKRTFQLFTVGSIPFYLLFPMCVSSAAATQSALPLYVFTGSAVFAVSCMGGTYSLLPAYEASLFGPKHIGAIHGRMMLASSGAAIVGGSLALFLRQRSERAALHDLLGKVDPQRFEETFKQPISQAAELIQTKSLSLNSLVPILPPDIPDPTPFVYHNALYTMTGFLAIAALAHSRVGPVDPKYFTKEKPPTPKS